jgi:hypothetical protein
MTPMTTAHPGGATPPASDLPLACVPDAIPTAERPLHFALLARLFEEAARERRELAGGYAFRFDADALDDVARFVANERRCCPFLAFTLELAPSGGPLWLRLTGPAGTRAFLDLELPRRPEWSSRRE